MTKYIRCLITLLLSVFTVNTVLAAELLVGPLSQVLTNVNPRLDTLSLDASSYKNLMLSFDYDSRELDGPLGGNDYFVYGWRSAGIDNQIGRIEGLPGATATEQGNVIVNLPVNAEVNDLSIYLEMMADSASDDVKITNLRLEGEKKIPPASTSTLTWSKQVVGTTSDWGFTFISPQSASEVFLSNQQATSSVNILAPGSYTITETPESGWQLVSIQCDITNAEVDLQAGTVKVDLQSGDQVSCVFTNTPVSSPVSVKLSIPVYICVNNAEGTPITGVRVELISASGDIESSLTDSSGCLALDVDAFKGPWVAGFVSDVSYQLVSVNTTSALSEVFTSTVSTWWPEACRLAFPDLSGGLISPAPGTPMLLPTEFNCRAVVALTNPPGPLATTSISSARGGGGGRNIESPEVVTTEVLPSPEALVLGEQVSVVPVGGVAAGVRPFNKVNESITIAIGLILAAILFNRIRKYYL